MPVTKSNLDQVKADAERITLKRMKEAKEEREEEQRKIDEAEKKAKSPAKKTSK